MRISRISISMSSPFFLLLLLPVGIVTGSDSGSAIAATASKPVPEININVKDPSKIHIHLKGIKHNGEPPAVHFTSDAQPSSSVVPSQTVPVPVPDPVVPATQSPQKHISTVAKSKSSKSKTKTQQLQDQLLEELAGSTSNQFLNYVAPPSGLKASAASQYYHHEPPPPPEAPVKSRNYLHFRSSPQAPPPLSASSPDGNPIPPRLRGRPGHHAHRKQSTAGYRRKPPPLPGIQPPSKVYVVSEGQKQFGPPELTTIEKNFNNPNFATYKTIEQIANVGGDAHNDAYSALANPLIPSAPATSAEYARYPLPPRPASAPTPGSVAPLALLPPPGPPCFSSVGGASCAPQGSGPRTRGPPPPPSRQPSKKFPDQEDQSGGQFSEDDELLRGYSPDDPSIMQGSTTYGERLHNIYGSSGELLDGGGGRVNANGPVHPKFKKNYWLTGLQINQVVLEDLNVFHESVTLSGYSSGGGLVQQLLVSHPSLFKGIAVFQQTYYRCGRGNGNVTEFDIGCTNLTPTPKPYDPNLALNDIRAYFHNGLIEDPRNLQDKKLYIYAGLQNEVFTPGQMLTTVKIFEPYINNVFAIRSRVQDASNLFPTDNFGAPCEQSAVESHFLGNCGLSGGFDALNFLLGEGAVKKPDENTHPDMNSLLEFDQSEFFEGIHSPHYMAPTGFLYVPNRCGPNNANKCHLHIYFHGCRSGRDFNDGNHIRHSGFLQLAELNDIIVMFPQIQRHVQNPLGCWDSYGYSGSLYATQKGTQISIIRKMMSRILGTDNNDLIQRSPLLHQYGPHF